MMKAILVARYEGGKHSVSECRVVQKVFVRRAGHSEGPEVMPLKIAKKVGKNTRFLKRSV